jgi:hypothetical protein
MTAKIILLNGPPRSGKDTAADFIYRRFNAKKMKFSDPVKDGTHASYGMPGIATDAFEDVKDEPRDEFLGMTPRRAYIIHSEHYMKFVHGPGVYGDIAARRVPSDGIAVFADSGFISEAAPVARMVGLENILVLRLFREGCTFDGDSRSYIALDGSETYDITNGSLEIFLGEIEERVKSFTA